MYMLKDELKKAVKAIADAVVEKKKVEVRLPGVLFAISLKLPEKELYISAETTWMKGGRPVAEEEVKINLRHLSVVEIVTYKGFSAIITGHGLTTYMVSLHDGIRVNVEQEVSGRKRHLRIVVEKI